ncbi:hypothetical protein [Paenibacillus sp. F4]|uniref:hypothetical protein n=1 Tax=Paenibacillus sp. F4 TaxID=357385 RepID=UPI000C9F9F8C|nr:hypothetical protein [Paenibacillus sp. F4]PNQ78893.1 hypothetical protein C1T21_22875 [Paenibacillus sp. F4]
MLNLFHPISQKSLTGTVHQHRRLESSLIPMGDVLGEVGTQAGELRVATTSQGQDHRRGKALKHIETRRRLVYNRPDNEWGVYELCKAVYELAEIDQVDFNGADLIEKMMLLRKLVPFVSSSALQIGVTEYHDSRNRQGWGMDFLKCEGMNYGFANKSH